jgi:hypothetical protein
MTQTWPVTATAIPRWISASEEHPNGYALQHLSVLWLFKGHIMDDIARAPPLPRLGALRPSPHVRAREGAACRLADCFQRGRREDCATARSLGWRLLTALRVAILVGERGTPWERFSCCSLGASWGSSSFVPGA